MVYTVLAQLGIPLLAEVLGSALRRLDHPAAKSVADALTGLDEAIRHGQVNPAQLEEANRHMEAMARMRSEEVQARLGEVNASLRAEIASQDKYVRRMRPTFGYLMAVTWAAQMLGLAWVIVFETDKAGLVLEAMESLGAIWAVGLSVLGIYVYKRSEDKKLMARFPAPLENAIPVPDMKPDVNEKRNGSYINKQVEYNE